MNIQSLDQNNSGLRKVEQMIRKYIEYIDLARENERLMDFDSALNNFIKAHQNLNLVIESLGEDNLSLKGEVIHYIALNALVLTSIIHYTQDQEQKEFLTKLFYNEMQKLTPLKSQDPLIIQGTKDLRYILSLIEEKLKKQKYTNIR